MATSKLVLALGVIAAAASAPAVAQDRTAPPGTADTRYCMKIETTGNVVQRVKCWTREQWAEQGVDVDKDWPREGLRIIG